MDGPRKYYTKWSKPDKGKGQISQYQFSVGSKKMTQTVIPLFLNSLHWSFSSQQSMESIHAKTPGDPHIPKSNAYVFVSVIVI